MTDFDAPGTLASVRYTRDTQEHAEIYALQSPKLTFVTDKEVQEKLEEIEDDAAWLTKLFRGNMETHKALWKKYMGNIDELSSETDPMNFCKRLYELVRNNTTFFSDREAYWKTIEEIPRDKAHMPFLELIVDRLYKLEYLERDQMKFDAVKNKPQERQELRKEITKTLNRSITEGHLRNIEASNLISALTVMALLKKDGVKDVTINIHLPLRWQYHNSTSENAAKDAWGKSAEEIEETTTDKLAYTMVRLAGQVNGIEVTAYPDEVGKLTLKFTDEPLRSDWPLLQDVINVVTPVTAEV